MKHLKLIFPPSCFPGISFLVFCFMLVNMFVFIPGTHGAASPDASGNQPATLAVLPFSTHTSEDLSHVQKGVVYMLHSRLAWPDQVKMVSRRQIHDILQDLTGTEKNRLIQKVEDQTGSDFVIDGSITKLAGSFSIDIMVYDIANKRHMTFFEQSKDSDDLITKVAQLAASINKQVFDRTTIAWEKMEQERQARINALKRQNPEHLMKNPQWQQTKDSPGWKIWKYLF